MPNHANRENAASHQASDTLKKLDFASLYPSFDRTQFRDIDFPPIITDRDEIKMLQNEGFEMEILEWKDRVSGVEFYIGIPRRDPSGEEVRRTRTDMLKKLYEEAKALKQEIIMERDQDLSKKSVV